MSFGHQSDQHKHLFPKHPLVSHRMVEDNGHTKIVKPEQDEGLRIKEPPAMREEPMNTHSSS
jgi:hypothetical protein